MKKMNFLERFLSKRKDFVEKISTPFIDDVGKLISGEEKVNLLIEKIRKNHGKIININYSRNIAIYTDYEMNNRQDIHSGLDEAYVIHYKSYRELNKL